MNFRYFVFITPWEIVESFVWTNFNPLDKRVLLVEIGPMLLKKKRICETFMTDNRHILIRKTHMSQLRILIQREFFFITLPFLCSFVFLSVMMGLTLTLFSGKIGENKTVLPISFTIGCLILSKICIYHKTIYFCHWDDVNRSNSTILLKRL